VVVPEKLQIALSQEGEIARIEFTYIEPDAAAAERGALEESLGVKSVSARQSVKGLTVLTNLENGTVEVQKGQQMKKNWANS
jgi:hypothetical protein